MKNRLHSLQGSHPAGLDFIRQLVPPGKTLIDACFISNPEATRLFLKYLAPLLKENAMLKAFGNYPSENEELSQKLSEVLGIEADWIFPANGASEAIRAVTQQLVKHQLVLLPNYTGYQEVAVPPIRTSTYLLKESDSFQVQIDPTLFHLKECGADSLVLINPNNPTGNYLNQDQIQELLEALPRQLNLILDESFVHFASVEIDKVNASLRLLENHPNLILIRSCGKDYGLSGLRIGYALMHPARIRVLRDTGLLWNCNAFVQWFWEISGNPQFRKEYELLRKKQIGVCRRFFNDLAQIENLKVYPSQANFCLARLPDHIAAPDFCLSVLKREGVYLRDCSNKTGLDQHYVRIAARIKKENQQIARSIEKELLC